VRRVLLVLVLAIAGAGWYGLAGSSSALAVNGQSVSDAALRSELVALADHPTLFCYYSSLASAALSQASAGNKVDSVTASGAAAWSNLRVEGLAVDHYVKTKFHYVATASDLATATSALEGEMTQAAAQSSQSCPGTAAQAVAEMPAEMRAAQVEDQASSMYLVSKLNRTITLTPANVRKFYDAHQSDYDYLCISVAVVQPATASTFVAAEKAGYSVAQLAKEFSVDPTGKKGGAYGCYGPTSSSYANIRTDLGTSSLGHFTTSPLQISYGSGVYDLFIAATKRVATPFSQAASLVVSDIQKLNATAANQVKANILYTAAVDIDPAYGRWGLSTSGPVVFAPALPATSGPASTSQLTSAATTPYQ